MNKNIKNRKFNWIPDLPDHRDFTYDKLLNKSKLKLAALPTRVNLRQYCSEIEDQGDLGSCTSQALVGNLEYLENKNRILPFNNLSRLFVYYNERMIENTVDEDSGAMLRDGVKSLVRYGCCSESNWQYDISKFTVKPTNGCYVEASKNKISSYFRLNTLSDMKHCLADGFPFVFGFSVYSDFMSDRMASTGVLYMPKKDEQLVGGHAVLAIGYNDKQKRFLVRNSWGRGWGLKNDSTLDGYFTIPFAYLQDRNLSDDFWTIRK